MPPSFPSLEILERLLPFGINLKVGKKKERIFCVRRGKPTFSALPQALLSYGFLYSGEKKTAVIMSLLLPTLIHILYYSTGFLHFTWKSRQSQVASDLGGHGEQVNLTN